MTTAAGANVMAWAVLHVNGGGGMQGNEADVVAVLECDVFGHTYL